MGGEIVPAVTVMSVAVVSITSIRVFDCVVVLFSSLCFVSYRVGVVIVLYRLVSARHERKLFGIFSWSMLISPTTVIYAVLCLCFSFSISVWRCCGKSGSLCGLL